MELIRCSLYDTFPLSLANVIGERAVDVTGHTSSGILGMLRKIMVKGIMRFLSLSQIMSSQARAAQLLTPDQQTGPDRSSVGAGTMRSLRRPARGCGPEAHQNAFTQSRATRAQNNMSASHSKRSSNYFRPTHYCFYLSKFASRSSF